MIANTPPPPYYAVIFTSIRTAADDKNYSEMAERMVDLATAQPGFLGVESVRDGLGITVSYWESLEAIQQWKQHSEHVIARELGRAQWYSCFKTRVCKVERDYGAGLL